MLQFVVVSVIYIPWAPIAAVPPSSGLWLSLGQAGALDLDMAQSEFMVQKVIVN
jgi:hypothetical protein